MKVTSIAAVLLAVATTVGAPTSAAAQTVSPYSGSQYSDPLAQGLNLGAGIDLVTGQVLDTCVSSAPLAGKPDGNAEGPKTQTFSARFVKEASSLRTALALSASASFQGVAAGGEASVSQKVDTISETEAAYLVLESRVSYDPESRSGFLLAQDAARLAKDDPAAFRARCGDSFVGSMTRGGTYRAIYRFSSLSQSARSELAATASAYGSSWGAKGEASKSFREVTSKYGAEVFVFQAGGKFERTAVGFDALLAAATGYAESITVGNAKVLGFTMRPYSSAKGLIAGTAFVDTNAYAGTVSGLADGQLSVSMYLRDLERRQQLLKRFPEYGDSETCKGLYGQLGALRQAAKDLLGKIRGHAESCRTLGKECSIVDLPDLDMPRTPRECAPRCSSDPSVVTKVDSVGYCTQCIMAKGSGPIRVREGQTPFKLTGLACSNMRPLAPLRVLVAGVYDPAPGEVGKFVFQVVGSGSPAPWTPGSVAGSEIRMEPNPPKELKGAKPISLGFRTMGRADTSIEVSAVLAEYTQSWNKPGMDRLVDFSGLRIAICDEDAGECALP